VWGSKLRKSFAFMAVIALACSYLPSAASPQEKSAVKPGFELATDSGKKILVFRPAVRVGSQSTGGMFEPNAEWTERALQNLNEALAKAQLKLGNTVVAAPEAYGDDARNVQEHMALFSAASQSIIQYQFFKGNRLPTKKADNKIGAFDWSLGTGVSKLPGASDADYGLFIYSKDAFGSTGRKLLQVVALLGPGIAVSSGQHLGYAGLVDLKTGDIVWLNADGQIGGDVRERDGAEKRIRQLLEDFPGGVTAKAGSEK